MPTSTLTDAFLKSVSVEERTDFRDEVIPGLMVRVTPSGVKTWALWYRDQEGRAHTLTLGRYPLLPIAAARDKARRELLVRRMGLEGLVRQEGPAPEGPAVTVGTLLARYLEEYSKPKKKTWRFDDELVRGPLVELADYQARDLSRGVVRTWFQRLSSRAPVHANRALALLRAAWNWAAEEELVPAENPAARLGMNREKARFRVLSQDEVRRLWEAIDRDGTSAAESIRLLLVTGQRRGEVLRMRFEDVALEGEVLWWTIPETKNGLPHRVPLLDLAKAVLARQFDRSLEKVFVFETDRKAAAPFLRSPMKAVARLKRLSGTSAWTPHDLRRTVASNMASLGVRREVLARVLNHLEAGVTAIYDRHSYDQEKLEAFRLWEERLRSLVQTKKGPALLSEDRA